MVIESPVVAFNERVTMKCVADDQYFSEDFFPFAVEADIGTGPNLTQDHTLER